MCLEGGCGACIVTATGKHPVTKEIKSWAINSCLTPVYACDGLHITTIEGIGNKKDGYHLVQKRLAEFHGTQCGYCSSGMVMNMYSLLEGKQGKVTMKAIENSFGGNICRCTGYRPILDAFKSMAIDTDPKYKEMCSGDIEELPKMCPQTGNICNGSCNGVENRFTLIFDDGKEWHKVKKLNEIFQIFDEINNSRYMLVTGNTANGVYRRDENIKVFIDVNEVEDLHRCSITDDKIVLGGNVNLTDTMEMLEGASKRKGFEYCEEIRKHIDLIANVPVRNAGTLAGNLSIKHDHKEFPSDLFLVLEACKAIITIGQCNQSDTSLTPNEYLKTDMNKKLILNITLRPLDSGVFKFKSYKIMPRAQNAHAYVNAAFLMEIQFEKVKSCNICFGGLTPDFIHAIKTENYLIGKNPYTADVVKKCVKTLREEIEPDWILPDANPEYRKKLAMALFFKFILITSPDDKLKPQNRSGGPLLERPISSGVQNFDTHKDKWPITQPVQKVEGLVQCSGEAQYINDIPHQPGELWAAFVPATIVHAKIISIDASDALKIPGVRYFFSAKDIPGCNNFTPTNMMMITEIEEIFCDGLVKFNGQPVGIILADSFELANHAAKIVKIEYIKTDKVVVPTVKQAYEKNATGRFHSTSAQQNVVSLSGSNIKKTIKGHFEIDGQYHFTLETQTTVCIPIEDGLEVYSATQWVDFVQVAISQCLKIPESSINMHVRRLGGGYGGKITRSALIACACALGCKLTNRPVRFVLSLESNMAVIGKRNGVVSDYEVHVDDRGKILKLNNDFAHDYGCSLNEDPVDVAAHFFSNCYNSDSWKVSGKSIITDSASNTWCRAPGSSEGIAMIENIMEHIAREIGLDPVDVRLENIPQDNKMKKLLPEFLNSVNYKARKSEINDFNSKNRWRKRGIAVVPMHYAQQFFGSIPVIVSIFHTDGTVAITHGGIECGQGINTKVVQVAARTLNIPMECIKVKPVINYVTPNSATTGGSMTSEAVSFATMRACEILLERMKPVREQMPSAKWHEITEACHSQNIELSTTYLYKSSDVQGYSIWGLSCAEVEVDILTGNLLITRVDILEDTGESISPYIDVGQIEGAFVMGLGLWLTEQLIYDSGTGELLTNRSWNYKPPGAKDIPIDFRINFLRNSPNPVSVLRSKATGEPALCMAIVVIFALRHALDSARKDAGLDNTWYNMNAPMTPEYIFLASGTSASRLKF